jgi:hypothetical protein
MMNRRRLIISLALLAVALIAQIVVTSSTSASRAATKFTVRVENISNPDGQTASTGAKWPFALSPGMFVLNDKNVLFTEGKPAKANGLEAQAEDGNPAGLVSSLETMHHAGALHGIYNTPVGDMGPGPITPGAAYEFSFNATPKMKLYLAFMFGQSNDLFYAPDAKGIALFDAKGNPLSGDVTEKLVLWDAGTEVNEEEGVGTNQAPRQKMANTGDAENGMVHRAKDVRFYGKNGELFRVTITAESGM